MTNGAPVFAPVLSLQEDTEAVTTLFWEVFETELDGVWHAPGRANVTGEHTDYSGGPTLPIALPHRAYLALRRREDRVVRLVSPQTRKKVDIMDLDMISPKGTPGEVAHWVSYIAGVAQSPERDGFENLLDFGAVLVSCVPLGGGLSSSAAPEYPAVVAIDGVTHLGLAGTAQEPDDAGCARLVTNCVCTENETAGVPTGGMDQPASMRCREGHALELDCRDGSVTHVPPDLTAEGLVLLVIDTKAKYSLDDDQYGARRAACERAAEIPGVGLLADIVIEDLPGALERSVATDGDDVDELVKRIRHVVTEVDRTRRPVAPLQDGQPLCGEKLAEVGRLMDASHESLCVDYECTRSELDVAVEATRIAGAHGAYMTSGGFGGSAIALADADAAHDVARAVAEAYQREGFNPPAFLDTVLAVPAGRLA